MGQNMAWGTPANVSVSGAIAIFWEIQLINTVLLGNKQRNISGIWGNTKNTNPIKLKPHIWVYIHLTVMSLEQGLNSI